MPQLHRSIIRTAQALNRRLDAILKADPDLELGDDFTRALHAMELDDSHVFITGRAGTGKSTLLKLFRDVTKKSVAVVAPTGAAAINVGGQTLHSFFRFPPRAPSTFEIRKSNRSDLYQDLDALIIDEVSMVRADFMDAIDKFLRINRARPDLRFGGVQMIMIGDLCQLPPVVVGEKEANHLAQHYGTAYFFGSEALRHDKLNTIELKKIFRQRDSDFVQILNAIRSGDVSPDQLDVLNARVDRRFKAKRDDPVVLLTPTNYVADRENDRRIGQLRTKEHVFTSASTDKFGEVAEKNLPAPSALKIRVGAHVMFVRNDRDRNWVNGTMGHVTEIEDEMVRVKITDSQGGHVWVEPETWEMNEFVHNKKSERLDSKVVGTFTQFPLRLGYAITVHKSQGKTLERVIVDMGRGAFAHGQTYVALSRVRSLEGLVLTRPITQADVSADPVVTDFLEWGNVPMVGQGRLF